MKILFICENFFPHVGGAEIVFKNLAERYVKLGHQVTVLTHWLKNTPQQEMINGVNIVRANSLHSRYVFSFSSIIKAVILARQHDLIQTTSFNGAPPAWLAGKIAHKPVVITVHEVWVGKWREITGFSWAKSFVHEVLERLIYWLPYDHYVCVSNSTRKDLEQLAIDKRKVTTIYNGFDHGFWSHKQASRNIKQELGWGNNFVFFSWGRAGPSKGFEYLIKAIPEICRSIPEARFLLMFSQGKTGSSRRILLRNLVKKLDLSNKVIILDQVPYLENKNYISSADCVIIPSTAEGFGYAALEAIALGTPVLVSSAGSLPEVVSGKHLIFQNKNHEDLIQKAGDMFHRRFNNTPLNKFYWEDCVNSYLRTYRQLMFH